MFNNITQNSTGNISVATAGNLIGTPPVVYDPGMMTYSGAGYYKTPSDNFTYSGNKLTTVFRFNSASFTGGSVRFLVSGEKGFQRFGININASDSTTVGQRNKLRVYALNNAGTVICRLWSINDVTDSADHTAFFSFDGDTGAATFYIDGVDADDTGNAERIAPTTGTLPSGTPAEFAVGILYELTLYNYIGQLGYIGYNDSYLTNPTDFYHPTNGLQELDTTTWTEWGSQPLVFSPDGKMDTNNLGSFGALTKVGTITGPA